MYRRAKAELYAENMHEEGTTLRVTLYKVMASPCVVYGIATCCGV